VSSTHGLARPPLADVARDLLLPKTINEMILNFDEQKCET
jgi:hypothetical protein